MSHPEMCYVFIHSNNSVGIVKWGESGYYETDFPHNYSEELVDKMNHLSGFTKNEIKAMTLCSMANIDSNNESWEKHYSKCLSILNNK